MRVTRTPVALLARLDPWAPPLAVMAAIFVLSAQPDLSTGLGFWDLILRKLVHISEYALLCFLAWRALARVTPERRARALALCVSLGYAGTDELHQTFVHGRHGTPGDVAIDSVGMVA